MAIKGIALVQNVGYSGNVGTANISFAFCSVDGATNVDDSGMVELTAGIGLNEAIRDHVQDALRTGGVTVTAIIDSIRVNDSVLPAT